MPPPPPISCGTKTGRNRINFPPFFPSKDEKKFIDASKYYIDQANGHESLNNLRIKTFPNDAFDRAVNKTLEFKIYFKIETKDSLSFVVGGISPEEYIIPTASGYQIGTGYGKKKVKKLNLFRIDFYKYNNSLLLGFPKNKDHYKKLRDLISKIYYDLWFERIPATTIVE